MRPDMDKSKEPTAEIIDETISGKIRHFSIRKNSSPEKVGVKEIRQKINNVRMKMIIHNYLFCTINLKEAISIFSLFY